MDAVKSAEKHLKAALTIVTRSAKINHLVAQKSPSFFKYILS